MRLRRALICTFIGAAASPALATYTNINAPFTGEDSQPQIISEVYGGNFTPVGLNYTNGTITATRVEDVFNSSATPTPTSPLDIAGNVGNDDQVWHGDFISATTEAIFADYTQEFGYYAGASGGKFVSLMDPSGKGFNISNGTVPLTGLSSDTIRWARNGAQGGLVDSTNSNNADGQDHMVTYRIDGLPDESQGIDTWMVFFEDQLTSQGSDFDYNDLAIQIKGKPELTVSVPEPTSLALLSIGGLLGMTRRRK
jgi:hypothetical protein